jgi:hypothetical protein
MRAPSVEHRFVSTRLTKEKRFDFTVDDRHWQELDEDGVWLKQMMKTTMNATFIVFCGILHLRRRNGSILVMNASHSKPYYDNVLQ